MLQTLHWAANGAKALQGRFRDRAVERKVLAWYKLGSGRCKVGLGLLKGKYRAGIRYVQRWCKIGFGLLQGRFMLRSELRGQEREVFGDRAEGWREQWLIGLEDTEA